MGSTTDKIKGKAMQVEGELTGDKVRSAQGVVEEKKGDAKGIVDRVVRKLKRVARRVIPAR